MQQLAIVLLSLLPDKAVCLWKRTSSYTMPVYYLGCRSSGD